MDDDENTKQISAITLSPQDIAILRKEFANIVRDYMPEARAVLAGTRTWNNNQLKLFNILTNKVIPDLHHSYTQIGIERKSVNELTREELEEIAASGSSARQGALIDITPPHLAPPDPYEDPISAKIDQLSIKELHSPGKAHTVRSIGKAKRLDQERSILKRKSGNQK